MRTSLLLAVFITACGGSGVVAVTDAWAGSTPPGADTAAIYLTIENDTSVDVIVASATSERCTSAEFHETRLDDQQVMRMRPATEATLTIGHGDRLEMRPGEMHIMCVGVIEPFEAGDVFGYSVTLSDGTVLPGEATVENR